MAKAWIPVATDINTTEQTTEPSLDNPSPVASTDNSCNALEWQSVADSDVLLNQENILNGEWNIYDLDLGDIIDAPAIQSLVEDFYALSSMPMGLIDIKGKVLAGVGWQDACTKFHRANPVACRNCVESDIHLSAGIPDGNYKIYKCKNNMWDVATPIMVGGRHLGNLFIGQFFFEDEPLDYELFRSQARQYGFDEKEYIAAIEAVPRMSMETLHTGMSFYMKLAKILSKLSYSNLKLVRSLAERSALTESLRQSEERLRLFIEYAPASLAMFDRDMQYLYVSRRWQSDYGLEGRNLLGLSHYDVFPEISEPWKEAHRRGLAGEVLRAEAERFERADGSVQWVLWEIRPWYNSTDNVGGIVIFTEDITERKKVADALQASEARMNRAQEIAHLGSWELDLVHGRLSWSDEVYRIFGLQPQEFDASYEAFLEAVHPDDRDAVNTAYVNSLREKMDSYEIEHRIIRKSSHEVRNVHEKCEHFRDESGRIVKSVGMVHDITERKRVEEELRRAKEAAEAATKAKSQFLANMSHELRTPMTGVLGMLDIVLGTPLNDKQRECISTARHSGRSLLRIINDILDLTKIEAGRLTIEEKPFNLRECVSGAIEVLSTVAMRKELALNLSVADELPQYVIGDQLRLRQILVNLIGNAVKFTEQGKVEVRVGSADSRSDGRRGITFTVSDTGIGIPDDKQHLLFNSFSQIDGSDSRRYGGTGLGLAISKEIVELMGGDISFESSFGAGSTFSFTVPLGESKADISIGRVSDAQDIEKPIPLPSEWKKSRLLLAEDDPVIRQILGMMLERSNYDLDIAENGRKAVEMWEQGAYDLILMDIQMPFLDGFAATRAIREKEKSQRTGRHTLIVAITAHASSDDEKRCLEAGMDAYVSKPIDLKASIQLFDNLIRQQANNTPVQKQP